MWITVLTVSLVLFYLLNIILYASYYFTSQLSLGSFAQVLYTMQNSMSGSESTWSEAVGGFFVRQWPWLLLGTLVYAGLLWFYLKNKKASVAETESKTMKQIQTGFLVLLAALVGLDAYYGYRLYDMFGIDQYNESQSKSSDLYENYYADPRTTKIEFPEKKRNLIYIICESMESTFADPAAGGGFKKSLIPELTKLAKENTDFSSDPKTLNGGLTPGNTGWTIAGITAQSMGIPLNIGNPDFNRNFEGESQFLPHVMGLGDILKEQGYSNFFMCGSEAEFAGRRNYYEQHGDYTIYDYNTAKKDKIIPQDYRVWWGMEDEKLFNYAKKELPVIAKEDEPFNFTMLTVDTHFTGGYLCPDCPDEFDNQYENVIRCSDHKVTEFVKWIQQQDFYKDTTIVITGDHKSMDGMVNENIPEGYERKTFFTVINGPEYTLNTTRQYATLDIYPTIIEALGASIEGDRLGLGTSLYSRTPTLIEELGFEAFNEQLNQRSEFYDSVILNGDESKISKPDEENGDSKEEENYEQQETPVTITAQEYQENRDSFTDPGYVWTPPVQDPVYDPGVTYPDPGTPEVPSEPSTGGDNTGTTTPPSGGDNTGGESGGTTPPESGGEGGNTGTNPPSGGDSGGTATPDPGGEGGGTTPPSTGGETGGTGTTTPLADPGTAGQTETPQ